MDFDGTLYFQKKLRLRMMISLLFFFILHPWKIKDLFVIILYRKMRENNNYAGHKEFDKLEIEDVSLKLGLSKDYVNNVIKFWMFKVPLKFISLYKDINLVSFLNEAIKKEKTVIIYSDYSVKEKIAAIPLIPTAYYYSGDPLIRCLKPCNTGLERILLKLKDNNIARENVLFIGDRFEKDGKCALNSNIDYLILASSQDKRKKQWKDLFRY
ncbi:hypothetical protein [Succinivibrio dextrinosolvens]|uniref:hypothetical protein n=1 Tax=Succinivibrio dextrinosolvens TaxID=83771 RepID=UPI001921CB8C|nr:hypothetical protein [Succinivibrio dextrinosolvens]